MFSTLKNAFKDKDIRSKIFFTLFILLLYRIGANITVPGVGSHCNVNVNAILGITGNSGISRTVDGAVEGIVR